MQRFNATLNSHCSSIQQCSACLQYASAVERMHKLEESLAIAKDNVARLAKARNVVHDPLSNVPQEIASRIMEIFYEDNSFYVGRPIKRFPPFKFGAVCQSWRVVAWSTPQIWSTVHFILKNRRGKKDFTRRLKLLEQYLARSGDLPLTIEVTWDDDFESEEFLTDEEISLELVDVLVSWIRRWHTVKLHFTPEMFHYLHRKTRRKHGASCPPTLRSLYLSIIHPMDRAYFGDLQFMDWTSITNGLRNLVVKSLFDFELDMLKVDCSSLEELEGCGSADALSRFLRASPLLQTAKVDIGEDNLDGDRNIDEDYPDEFGQPFIQRTLSRLELNFAGDYNMSSIFTNLTCPNLDTLAIEKRGTCPGTYLDTLPYFLSRLPKLRELTLRHISWPNTILRRIFSSLHSVEKVGICGVTPAFVSQVLNAGDPDCILRAPFPDSLRILSFEYVLWKDEQVIQPWDFLPTIAKHHSSERRQQCASEDAGFHIKITINANRQGDLAVMLLLPQHLEAIATLNTTGIKVEISLSRGFPELKVRDLVVFSASVWEDSERAEYSRIS